MLYSLRLLSPKRNQLTAIQKSNSDRILKDFLSDQYLCYLCFKQVGHNLCYFNGRNFLRMRFVCKIVRFEQNSFLQKQKKIIFHWNLYLRTLSKFNLFSQNFKHIFERIQFYIKHKNYHMLTVSDLHTQFHWQFLTTNSCF